MNDLDQILERLNPQQREAVVTTDGPLLVIAGAGSGKTRVITHRIAYLIRSCGVAPWQIFAATFTNKAAEEMRHRVTRIVPGADAHRLAVATFHSLCVGILRREAAHAGLSTRFTICDDSDQLALIKDCLRNLSVPTKSVRPEQIRSWIGAAKIQMLEPDEARRQLGGEMGAVAAEVYKQYQQRLVTGDAVDFDDLILHVVRIFRDHPDVLEHYQNRWRYLLVDEYQDTNRVQFEFIRLLAASHGNLCVVGDEDQSIYSWRGAEIENLLKFSDLFPGTRIIRLEQNYRSTETILMAAGAVIANNRQRLGKELWSERGRGERVTFIAGHNERDEAAQVLQSMEWLHKLLGVAWREMAIFYRVNALSRVFEDQLRQRGIAYRVIGGIKFYDRAEVKDQHANQRLVVNPRDGGALSRVVNVPPRGIGARSMGAVYDAAVAADAPLWDTMVAMTKKDQGVSGKARAGVVALATSMKEWQDYAENHAPHEVLDRILRDIQYEEYIGDGSDIESVSRRANIDELVTALEQYHEEHPDDGLCGFLERIALVTAQDAIGGDDAVSLMTLHCAKGLEYRAVFMVGMEDPIFPSQRAVNDQGDFEEERRLFYVGITRAMDYLFLSRADSRTLHGRPCYNTPSLFLREVPPELLRTLDQARRDWASKAGDQPERAPRRERSMREPGCVQDRAPLEPSPVLEAEASPSRFTPGMRVCHNRLGEGDIIAVTGEGARRKITVRFDAGLELEVLEQYGGLEPVTDNDLPF